MAQNLDHNPPWTFGGHDSAGMRVVDLGGELVAHVPMSGAGDFHYIVHTPGTFKTLQNLVENNPESEVLKLRGGKEAINHVKQVSR